jgi:hypothetical protein
MTMRWIDCAPLIRCVIVKSCACLMTVRSWRANVRHCFGILNCRVTKRMKLMPGVNGQCWCVHARSSHCSPRSILHVIHFESRCVFRRDRSILHLQFRRQTRILPIALHPSCQWNASLRVSPIDFQLKLICRACFAWMLIDSMCVCLLIDLVA